MNGLKDFLLRFKHLEPREPKIVQAVIETLNTTLGVSLESKSIVVQRNTAFLQGSPSLKKAVNFKKEEILSMLKKTEYGAEIIDIR